MCLLAKKKKKACVGGGSITMGGSITPLPTGSISSRLARGGEGQKVLVKKKKG